MKVLKILVELVLALLICTPAWADHGHAHFGIVVGYPWAYPYPPAYYYPPYYQPTVVVQPAPVYVEQGGLTASAPQEASYWYYCNASKTYYPYVKECPAGWQKVAPSKP